MNADSAYFTLALVLQGVFTAAVVLIVRWRFPRRLRAYRILAPAAVPAWLFARVAFAFVAARSREGIAFDASGAEALARIAIAYLVLWLIGVLFATLLIRIAARFR